MRDTQSLFLDALETHNIPKCIVTNYPSEVPEDRYSIQYFDHNNKEVIGPGDGIEHPITLIRYVSRNSTDDTEFTPTVHRVNSLHQADNIAKLLCNWIIDRHDIPTENISAPPDNPMIPRRVITFTTAAVSW